MKAPSEKHLEDWIVANPEKTLPNFWYDGHDFHVPLISTILRRQPNFSHGRPDIVFKSPTAVCVMELKRGPIKADTVTQCLRYMYDLRDIGYSRHNQEWNVGKRELPIPEIQNRAVLGFVVGNSIPDSNLLLACELIEITPILYEYDGENYTFKIRHRKHNLRDMTAFDWADGAVGDAFLDAMYELRRREEQRGLRS